MDWYYDFDDNHYENKISYWDYMMYDMWYWR